MFVFVGSLFLVPMTILFFVVEPREFRMVIALLAAVDIAFIVRAHRQNQRADAAWERKRREEEERDQTLLSEGIEAEGTIRSVEFGGRYPHYSASYMPKGIQMRVDVEPEDGDAFSALVDHAVETVAMPQYQPGQRVLIQYHSSDPERYNRVVRSLMGED